MNRILVFRLLTIASVTAYIIWFFLPYLASDTDQQIQSYSGHGALMPVQNPVYYWTWFVLWLTGAIGILLFQNWGRYLYLGLSLLNVLLMPFSGYAIQTALDATLSSASLVLDGVVLGIAYFSPLREYFAGKPQPE